MYVRTHSVRIVEYLPEEETSADTSRKIAKEGDNEKMAKRMKRTNVT